MQIGIIKRYGIFNSKNRSSENSTRFRVSSTFELEYVISASTSTHFNGKRYELSPNSFIIVKPNQKRVTLNNFKCYYIHLDLSQENEFFELLKNLPDYVLLINPEQCKTTMKELISHLITHGYDPQCEFVNAKLLELFYHLKTNLTQNKFYTKNFLQSNNFFLPHVIDYINTNFANKITLQTLSERINYSPNYFHSVFSNVMGTTPQNYITNVRISNAKYKLSNSSKSIATIAYECGFSSQSHFSATFKKYTKMTPNEYRRLCYNNYPK